MFRLLLLCNTCQLVRSKVIDKTLKRGPLASTGKHLCTHAYTEEKGEKEGMRGREVMGSGKWGKSIFQTPNCPF